jgi:serine/threonine protein kinase
MSEINTGAILAGKYKVLKKLGAGAFGAVYLVEHVQLAGEKLALKTLHPHLASDAQRRERFLREVKVALKLVHPHIVTIRDFGETESLAYYTMDFIEGATLEKILEEEKALVPSRALRLGRQILDALAVAHDIGIIHRDMKPDNVLVVARGSEREAAKVLDFGIAKFASEATGLTGEGMIGTPVYMSPEQGAGRKAIDARSDLYSVGVVLYHLLAGRPPFVSETPIGYVVQHQFDPPPSLAAIAPERRIPPEVEELVLKALAKDPAGRHESAQAMIDEIDDLEIMAGTSRRTPSSSSKRAAFATGARTPAAPAGPPPLDWAQPLPGQIVDKYALLDLLGEGGFGAVCVAQHSFLGRKVALKLLRKELSGDPTFIGRFRREARIAASLEHPAIVTIFDYGEAAGTCYLAMELLAGETLAARIARGGGLAPDAAAAVLRPVLAALAHAHGRGVVHRDLKPENIIVLVDGRAKVLDFGIAKILEGASAHLTQSGSVLGTPLYISPEQARGDTVDHRADIYALGAILFECLAGRPPFLEEQPAKLIAAHVKTPPPRLGAARPDILFSEALEEVVARALAKDPAARFASASEMLAVLEAAIRPPAPPPPAPALGRWEIAARARVELPGADGRRRSLFLFATPSLPFGRARPGTDGAAIQNEIVLRLLPCRSEAQDRDNFQATRRVSGHHGEFVAAEGAVWLVDRSTLGTTIDGVRVPREARVRLPGRFRLCVAEAIELEGEVLGAEGAAEALALRRVGNYEGHEYVWVLARAAIEGRGEVVNDGGTLRYAGAPNVRGAPFRPDDLTVAD